MNWNAGCTPEKLKLCVKKPLNPDEKMTPAAYQRPPQTWTAFLFSVEMEPF